MTRITRAMNGRRIGVIAMVLIITGCHGWYARPGMTIPEVVAERPDRVRVTRVGDSDRIVLVDPRMRGDTLYGMSGHWRTRVGTPIPSVEVRLVETRRFKPYATVATALGVTAAAVGITFLIAFLSLDCSRGCLGG